MYNSLANLEVTSIFVGEITTLNGTHSAVGAILDDPITFLKGGEVLKHVIRRGGVHLSQSTVSTSFAAGGDDILSLLQHGLHSSHPYGKL